MLSGLLGDQMYLCQLRGLPGLPSPVQGHAAGCPDCCHLLRPGPMRDVQKDAHRGQPAHAPQIDKCAHASALPPRTGLPSRRKGPAGIAIARHPCAGSCTQGQQSTTSALGIHRCKLWLHMTEAVTVLHIIIWQPVRGADRAHSATLTCHLETPDSQPCHFDCCRALAE